MNYTIFDRITGTKHFELETEAEVALVSAQTAFLEQESYRFSIATVLVDGTNTIWRTTESTDSKEGDYRVFNHNIGGYESFTTLSSAHTRVEELKNQFLVDAKLDKVYPYTPEKNQMRVDVPGEIL